MMGIVIGQILNLRNRLCGQIARALRFHATALEVKAKYRFVIAHPWTIANLTDEGGIGYESEAAFNRAFKREYGQPPGRYRSDTKISRTKNEPSLAARTSS